LWLPTSNFGIPKLAVLTNSQRAAIHAKRITIMPPDSYFVRNMWHTIDKDCAIGAYDDASARIIGRRWADITNKRQAKLAECRALVAEKKREGLKPVTKAGEIKGWRPMRDDEASDDDLFSATGTYS
jgi:hypothetical protein